MNTPHCLECHNDTLPPPDPGKKQPRMTQEEYRQSGGSGCPQCRSGDVYPGEIDMESGLMLQKMTCLDCDLSWHDMYRLVSYVRLPETPEGQADDAYFQRTFIAVEPENA